jgi:tRNA(Ile)-lysidine synthase
MIRAFLTFINEYLPDLPSRKTLLAVSGGVDSMVMAELFLEAGLPFVIAHCNFGLRQEESDQDENFVRQWAESHGAKAFFRRFDTVAKATQKGISIQMAARDLRYAWFDELLQNHSLDYIATAHHGNDALETTLLNLVRGTGLAGLPGIVPRQGNLVRPLLFATKQEIVAHARHHQIAWHEDSSNQSHYYRRNLLRHQVVPVLQQINPSLESTFRLTAERLNAANSLLKGYLTKWKEQTLRQEGNAWYIPVSAIQDAREPALMLHFLLDPFGYNYAQTKQIVASLSETSGKLFYSQAYQLLKDRNDLIIEPMAREAPATFLQVSEMVPTIKLPDQTTLTLNRIQNNPDFTPLPDPAVAYFDESKVCFPLTIRPWQKGDWLCPFGMSGKRKKISDLLVDMKVPLTRKKECLVMLDGNQNVIWVIGIRADDRFRVQADTHRILFLRKT